MEVEYTPFKISPHSPVLIAGFVHHEFGPDIYSTEVLSSHDFDYTKAYDQKNHDPTDEIRIAMKIASTLPIKSYQYLLRLHKSKRYGYLVGCGP